MEDDENDNSAEYERIRKNILVYAHMFCETLFPLITILASFCIYKRGYNEAYTDCACVFIFYQMVFINCLPYAYVWVNPWFVGWDRQRSIRAKVSFGVQERFVSGS